LNYIQLKVCLFRDFLQEEDKMGWNKILLAQADDNAWVLYHELTEYNKIEKGGDNRLVANFYRFNNPNTIELIYYEL